MIKLLFLSLLILSVGSCNKTIPDSTIRSLSGKDYAGANSGLYSASDISLVKDFLVSGHGISIKEYVELPSGGGFIFTIENGDHPNGEELFIYDEATRKWSLLLDLMPEKFEGSKPMGLKIANNHLYFTANTGSGRELYKYNLSSDVHTKLTDINNGGPQILETNNKLPFEVYIDDTSTVRVYTMFEYTPGSVTAGFVLGYIEDVATSSIVNLMYLGGIEYYWVQNVEMLMMGDNNFYVYHENDAGTMQITKFDYDAPISGNAKDEISKVTSTIKGGKKKWTIIGDTLYYMNQIDNLLEYSVAIALGSPVQANELINFNGVLYSVDDLGNLVKNPLGASTNFDFTGGGNSKVKNLTVSNGHLCFSAVLSSDRILYCSKGSTPSSDVDFEVYDFDTDSYSERAIGNIIATDSGIAVAAADVDGSSVFHIDLTDGTVPILTNQTQLLPYREKLYGYIEQNYNRFFSVGNTIVTTNLFDVVNSYHGPLAGLSSSLQDDFIDNAIAGENGSSLVIVKFAYGNKLFGNFVGNTNEFWSLDLSSQQVTSHTLGAIQSELYPYGGKIYFAVKYRGFDELVEFDPALNTGVHLHPCGVNEANLADWCHPGELLGVVRGEIKIHGIFENHLFYTALTHESSSDDPHSFELFGIDLSAAAPADAKMYSSVSYVNNNINDIVFAGVTASSDVFYIARSGASNFSAYKQNISANLSGGGAVSGPISNVESYLIKGDELFVYNGDQDLLAFNSTGNSKINSNTNTLGFYFIDGEIYHTLYNDSTILGVSRVVGIDYTSGGLVFPSVTESYLATDFSAANTYHLFNNEFYYTKTNGSLVKISTPLAETETYPNVLNSSGLDCDPIDFKIFDINQNMISFYCDDQNSLIPSVTVYSISEQKSYYLYNYGIIYDLYNDRDNIKTIYSDQDKAIFYSTQYNEIGVTETYEFSTGKLFEINLKSGLISYLGIDNEEVFSSELGFGKYYTCANGHLSLYNFNLSNEPFTPENAICAEKIAGISIVPYIYDQKAYLPLIYTSPSSPDIGLELYQIEI